MTITYRTPRAQDAATLSKLGRATFTETFGHLYSPENLAAFLASHSPELWHEEIIDPNFRIRLAEEDGQAAGYVKLGPPSLPFEPRGRPIELRQLYVLKPWHGRGVAAALMEWALKEARAAGADEMYLSVFTDNHRARRFYERYGFVFVQPYAFMVGTHADEDHILRLDLKAMA
jgi:GNAT superfamily N-acetyltransferase